MGELPYYPSIELLKSLVADEAKLVALLLSHLDETTKAIKGLSHAAPTVLTNESDANTRKMLNTTMNLVKRQQEFNQLAISVLILLVGSRDFQGWQAELAVKLGSDPSDVLRKMMQDKLRGVRP